MISGLMMHCSCANFPRIRWSVPDHHAAISHNFLKNKVENYTVTPFGCLQVSMVRTQCTAAATYSPPTPLGKWQKVGYGLTEIYSLPSLSHLTSHTSLPLALSSFINDRSTRNSLIVGWKWKRDKEAPWRLGRKHPNNNQTTVTVAKIF